MTFNDQVRNALYIQDTYVSTDVCKAGPIPAIGNSDYKSSV